MPSKNFSDSDKKEIWKKYCGDEKKCKDAFGRWMTFKYFECDHIFPKSLWRKTYIDNGMPLSEKSNEEKSDDKKGKIIGKNFEVKEKISKRFKNRKIICW